VCRYDSAATHHRAMQTFDKMKVGTGTGQPEYFLEGVDDTHHREVELQILHQTVHFSPQKAKNRVALNFTLMISLWIETARITLESH
jgi:hypothetical protein